MNNYLLCIFLLFIILIFKKRKKQSIGLLQNYSLNTNELILNSFTANNGWKIARIPIRYKDGIIKTYNFLLDTGSSFCVLYDNSVFKKNNKETNNINFINKNIKIKIEKCLLFGKIEMNIGISNKFIFPYVDGVLGLSTGWWINNKRSNNSDINMDSFVQKIFNYWNKPENIVLSFNQYNLIIQKNITISGNKLKLSRNQNGKNTSYQEKTQHYNILHNSLNIILDTGASETVIRSYNDLKLIPKYLNSYIDFNNLILWSEVDLLVDCRNKYNNEYGFVCNSILLGINSLPDNFHLSLINERNKIIPDYIIIE